MARRKRTTSALSRAAAVLSKAGAKGRSRIPREIRHRNAQIAVRARWDKYYAAAAQTGPVVPVGNAAQQLGVARNTLKAMVRRGEVQTVMVRDVMYIPARELERLLREREKRAQGAALSSEDAAAVEASQQQVGGPDQTGDRGNVKIPSSNR